MPLEVSVVVPFFNPGANIAYCLDSLLAQTLAPDRYEIVLVDDGSTDGSPARVESVRARRPDLVRVERISASGWAGAPRNRGVAVARGKYVQFVDADDGLHPRALERLLAVATESDADIVVGKLSSDFRNLNHPIYRHTETRRTFRDFPLVESLTPHKMFRRALLVDNGIRFAEGPRHVEDEHFCMQAYTRADSVAIVGDLNCYYYRRRRSAGRNLGDTVAVPSEYYRDLSAILDVIDAQVADPLDRIPLQRRFYRVEMLGRLRGRAMQTYPPDYRDEIRQQVRELATTRFAPAVREGLPCFVRTQSRLMLDAEALVLTRYAGWLDSIRLAATISLPRWDDGRLCFDIDATLSDGDEPLRLDAAPGGWEIPARVAPGTDATDRAVTAADLATVDVDCATVSRASAEVWSTTDGIALAIEPDGGVVIRGTVAIDPSTVMGGTPLSAGLWDLRLRLMFGGLTRAAPLRPADGLELPVTAWLPPAPAPASVAAYWTEPTPALALDVDEWSHALQDLLGEAPTARIRRWRQLEIAMPAVSGGPASRGAELLLEPAGADGRTTSCQARLVATRGSARVLARLPLPARTSRQWRAWLRIGEAGSAPPQLLPFEVRRERRRYSLVAVPPKDSAG